MDAARTNQRTRSRWTGRTRLTGIFICVIGLLLMILGFAIAIDAVIQWVAPA
jgi:preprotein translocase subunit SecE